MNEIHIENFGPVKEAKVSLEKQMQLFIGAQASGKSTICKVVYFCQKIRDYALDFLMDANQFTYNHENEYYSIYLKYLTRQFMGCFGKTTHMPRFKITYVFNDKKVVIQLNRDGYVRFLFDDFLKKSIQGLIDESAKMYLVDLKSKEISSVLDSMTALAMLKKQINARLEKLFENDRDIVYVPAGRSLLAMMSEQLHDFSIADMDLTMQEFITLIRNTKSRFGSKIPDIVKEYTKTVSGQINNSSLDMAYELIHEIFKADYTSETDGEKVYFDEHHWVKLMYSSSGQQEVLWILMLSFIFILEKRKCFFIVEEPEAHLFPLAQKKVVDLLALMSNSTGSSVIITTHSPYILTSLNILLYSDKIETRFKGKNGTVIPKSLRLSFEKFAAFKLTGESDSPISLMDAESHMIDTDYIDEVSSLTNQELEELMEMEG